MRILTVENIAVNLDKIPDNAADLHYCIYDSIEKDYFWPSLITGMESFFASSVNLEIGKYNIQMPLDWSILLLDESWDNAEMMPFVNLNNRDFTTPVYNPMKVSIPDLLTVQISNIFSDVKCYFPRLKSGHILAIPLENQPAPKCAFFAKDINKIKSITAPDLLG